MLICILFSWRIITVLSIEDSVISNMYFPISSSLEAFLFFLSQLTAFNQISIFVLYNLIDLSLFQEHGLIGFICELYRLIVDELLDLLLKFNPFLQLFRVYLISAISIQHRSLFIQAGQSRIVIVAYLYTTGSDITKRGTLVIFAILSTS
ncbi:hypothetical protein A6R73_11465 [Xanthomonas translucens pv. poae]|uniref:Uncharacterized protein n=1 Tax=Xanthomonas graminis pv. poae TaxID=227946 RepID=A0A199P7N4_9XANT|nr:hypothetical protein A6R73_11465 [Xanthomonas translucens pv. poae]